MRMGKKSSTFAPMKDSPPQPAGGDEWEVRPCGMLVQKRNLEGESASAPAPTIRVRVKYGSAYHEIYISSQATFGELKKLLSGPTGLHPLDQKILFKDKERESTAYLDTAGVKDKSKLVVLEDLKAQAKRCLETRRAAKSEKASKSIAQISLEVDKLAAKVSALEAIIAKGKRVAESDVLTLIELLMNELLKLDAVMADGDVKLQRRMQVRRVQKYVETLDMLKIKNSMSNGLSQQHQQIDTKRKASRPSPPTPAAVVTTTKWETFDSLFSTSAMTTPASSAATSASSSSNPTPRLDWELF